MYFKSLSIRNRFRFPLRILSFALVIGLFVFGLSAFGKSTLTRQQASLETAIARDIAECYAFEGMYPPSLSYMKEHYGLTYDESVFYVDYRPIGANLYPDYIVMVAGQ